MRLAFVMLLIATPAHAQLAVDDGWSFAAGAPSDQPTNVHDLRYVDGACRWSGEALALPADDPRFERSFDYDGPVLLGVRRGASGARYTFQYGATHEGALLVVVADGGCDEGWGTGRSLMELTGDAVPPLAAWDGLVPIRADGTAYLPTAEGLYALPLDPPEGAQVTLAVSLAQLGAALGVADPRIVNGVITPGDALWLLVQEATADPGDEPRAWLVEVARDGALTIVAHPSQLSASAYYEGRRRRFDPGQSRRIAIAGELDALALEAAYTWWLVPFSAERRAGRLGYLEIGHGSPPLVQPPLVQAAGDTLALGTDRIAFDLSRLDPDRDMLPWRDELARGTDPLDADSDGDGVPDGVEVWGVMSDPRDPRSPARARPEPIDFAPSLMMNAWPFAHQEAILRGNQLGVTGAEVPALCVPQRGFSPGAPNGDYVCRYADGEAVFDAPTPHRPVLAADGSAAAFIADHLDVVDLTTGESRRIEDAPPRSGIYPLDADVVFHVLSTATDDTLVRYGPTGTFAVIDLGRECPILGAETQRDDVCGALYQRQPFVRGGSIAVLGYHPAERGFVVSVDTLRGALYVLVDRERARFIGHVLQFDEGAPTALAALPDGTLVASLDGEAGGLALLDATLAVVHHQPLSYGPMLQAFFRHGFFSPIAYGYYGQSPQSGGCVGLPGMMVCGKEGQPSQTQLYSAVTYAEWVPVAPGLERGEAIFWSGHLWTGGVGLVEDEDWALWRVTRRGGVHRWLDRAALAALSDADGRARLDERPLGEVAMSAVSAEPSGPWRLCFVEGGRLWELSFDDAREPVVARFIAEDVIACGYEAGERVALREVGDEAVLDFEGGERVRMTSFGPRGLVRLGASWLVLGASSVCVADGSRAYTQVSHAPLHASAAADQGLVYLVGADGRGHVVEEGVFCTGGASAEALYDSASPPLWEVVGKAGATVGGVTIGLRPDGVLLVAPERLSTATSNSDQIGFFPELLWGITPSYVPLYGWAHRLEVLDPQRREVMYRTWGSLHARRPRALSIVPWTERWDELGWSHLGGAPPAPRVDVPDPPERPDVPERPDEPARPTPKKKGCAGGGLTPWAAVAILLLGRRLSRRRWRLGRAPGGAQLIA